MTRSPKGARTSAAAANACWSRSMPTNDRSGRASSNRRAWPPPPTVASTSVPAGTGWKIRTISSAITGTWWNSVMLVTLVGRPYLRPPAVSLICSPPAGGCRRDVSPTSETEAGGVGAVHLADRETADERGLVCWFDWSSPPFVVFWGARGGHRATDTRHRVGSLLLIELVQWRWSSRAVVLVDVVMRR